MPGYPIHWYRVFSPSPQPPLVLLHGFTGAPESWRRVVDAFDGDATVVALPLPGHHPDAPVARTFDAAADQLAQRLESASLAGCHLVGYSMGARLALATCVRHPDIASRLSLIGVHPGLDDDAARDERTGVDKAWIAVLRHQGTAAFVTEWERAPLFATQRYLAQDALAEQRRIRLAHDPERLASALERLGLARMPACGDALVALASAESGPAVELIVGELDAKFAALAAALAARAAAITVRAVAGAGHNVPLERPRELARLLATPTATTVTGLRSRSRTRP